jgi:glucose-1-phosphate thymidylyltransferase
VKGIILAGGSGTRLYPLTQVTSKQLMPIYDKPMIYYPLSVLMEAGIKDILIISTPQDTSRFEDLLGDGSAFGIKLTYDIQPSPDGLAQAFLIGEKFIGNDTCAMILGDNIFHGPNFKDDLKQAALNATKGYATIFGYHVHDPERFGIVEFSKDGKVLSVEEKPTEPKSNYAITGLYFYPKGVSTLAKKVKPSKRGELEITDLNRLYLEQNKLKAITLYEGYGWFDTGTFESLLTASSYVGTIQEHQNITICCPEEIGAKQGWLTKDKLLERAELMKKNTYGKHLLEVSKDLFKESK